MANIDDVKAKTSCPLHTLFCIINQIQADCVEPWYEQIKRLAEGADKLASGMHKAVIFGMYPELEEASKEFYHSYKDIYSEFKNNPNKDKEYLSEQLKELSFKTGEKYGLNKNKYLFNKMTEEQAKRVQKRKDLEIKNMCNESAEAMLDPLHIVMQGLYQKLDPKDCKKLMQDFHLAKKTFDHDRDNNREMIEFCKEEYPEAYSIYKQVKNSLEVAKIKDCYQNIDAKNYASFVQTLECFEYNGKKYNLLDVVRPITQKRDAFGRITEKRTNTFSAPQQIYS